MHVMLVCFVADASLLDLDLSRAMLRNSLKRYVREIVDLLLLSLFRKSPQINVGTFNFNQCNEILKYTLFF